MNLLDNWDFTNPVNQRGKTSYVDEGYAIDRWKIAEQSKITVNSDSISVKGRIYQLLEDFAALKGETVTLSLLYTNNTNSAEGRINVLNGSTWLSENVNIKANVFKNIISTTFTVPNTLSEFAVNFISENATIKLHAYKLELGEVSTLKNDLLGVSYAEELRKCRRYYRKLPGLFLTGVWLENGDIRSNAISIEEMRTAPVISITSDGIRTGKGLMFVGFGKNGTGYINCAFKGKLILRAEDNGSSYITLREGLEIVDFNGNLLSSPDSMITFGTEVFDLELSADL